MSRVKHPVEKKRLSLDRDHRVFVLEGNKSFRKAWHLKKVKASRQLRRRQAKELLESSRSADIETKAHKSKRILKKLGVMSLSQAIAFKVGEIGSRWDNKILVKNKEALRAARRRAQKPRRARANSNRRST